MPVSVDTAVTTQTLLGTLTLSDPVAPAAAARTLTFSAITSDSAADHSDDATWARILDSDGTAIVDVDVGESGDGCFITLNEKTIAAGGPIGLTAFTISYPA